MYWSSDHQLIHCRTSSRTASGPIYGSTPFAVDIFANATSTALARSVTKSSICLKTILPWGPSGWSLLVLRPWPTGSLSRATRCRRLSEVLRKGCALLCAVVCPPFKRGTGLGECVIAMWWRGECALTSGSSPVRLRSERLLPRWVHGFKRLRILNSGPYCARIIVHPVSP